MKYIDIVNKIEGWCSVDKMTKLYNLIVYTKPDIVVEIGVFAGKSLIPQALALKDNKHGTIIGIDAWDKNESIKNVHDKNNIKWWSEINHEDIYNKCVKYINDNNLQSHVKLIKSTSKDCISEIPDNIDILHIDGNHEEMNSCMDVELYVPKIRKGGYLWFDDAKWSQTQKAVKLIEDKYKLTLINKADSDDPNNCCNLYIKL